MGLLMRKTIHHQRTRRSVQDTLSKNHINWKRYFNVLFSDEISPKLATRGKTLTKEQQMTAGLKPYELLHKEIIMEYNNKDKYNKLAHHVACRSNPAICSIQSLGVQSKEMLATVIREYERSFSNWKISGEHGGFGEANTDVPPKRKSFSEFTLGINSLLYLHEFVFQFPDVLSKVFGELPKWAF